MKRTKQGIRPVSHLDQFCLKHCHQAPKQPTHQGTKKRQPETEKPYRTMANDDSEVEQPNVDTSRVPEDSYLTPADVAQLLRVTPRTVSRWADEGRIAHIVTLGGHRRFLQADVLRLLDVARRLGSESTTT